MWGNLWGDRRGVAAIEFVFVAPVLLTILLGCLDVGRMFYVSQCLQNATQQAARYYALNPGSSTSDVTTYLQGQVLGGIGSNVSVTYTPTSNCNSNANVTCTTIQATYPFTFAAGYLGLGTKRLKATSQAVVNNP